MAYRISALFRILACLACVRAVSASPIGAEVLKRGSAAIRAEASSLDGWSSALDLSAGAARLSFRLFAEPGKAPEAKAGGQGQLWTAGPVRHSGLTRLLDDPCADAYIFTGSWAQPLVLDFDSRYYGAFFGSAAGAWCQDASAPRMGLWAGTEAGKGFRFGAAAAFSRLPESGAYDSWFEDEPPAPERLLAAGVAWAGFLFPAGSMIAAFAVSEADRGGRGWSFRTEGEYVGRRFRAISRFSCASPGWRGLGGSRADPWEARADASWSIRSRLRLEGRLRLGQDAGGEPDWESRIRVFRDGKVWSWGAELGGSDSSRNPPVRLDPAVWAGWEGKAVRTSVRASWVTEGAGLTRTEVSASLVLGSPIRPNFRLEGARRWATESPYWKAAAALEIPGDRGAWTVRAGTGAWGRDGAPVPWELSFALRCRGP